MIALSQLSRAPEARTDRRPQLSDLRECVDRRTPRRRCPSSGACRSQARPPALRRARRWRTIVVDSAQRPYLEGRPPARLRVVLSSGPQSARHGPAPAARALGPCARRPRARRSAGHCSRRSPEPSARDRWTRRPLILLGHLRGLRRPAPPAPALRTARGRTAATWPMPRSESSHGCLAPRRRAAPGINCLPPRHALPSAGLEPLARQLGVFEHALAREAPAARTYSARGRRLAAAACVHLWATGGVDLGATAGLARHCACQLLDAHLAWLMTWLRSCCASGSWPGCVGARARGP